MLIFEVLEDPNDAPLLDLIKQCKFLHQTGRRLGIGSILEGLDGHDPPPTRLSSTARHLSDGQMDGAILTLTQAPDNLVSTDFS
jgi:hypothetical protein